MFTGYNLTLFTSNTTPWSTIVDATCNSARVTMEEGAEFDFQSQPCAKSRLYSPALVNVAADTGHDKEPLQLRP